MTARPTAPTASPPEPSPWPYILWPLGIAACFLWFCAHRPRRITWGKSRYWSGGWRCVRCGRSATTAEELMGLDPGYVSPRRKTY